MSNKLKLNGQWVVTHRGIDGKIKSQEIVDNLVTNEGINYALNASMHGGTQISDWYVAPWKTNTAVSATNTYASPGNTEATEYGESTRQAWAEGAAASQSITNATAATITANASVTIYGLGIVGGGSAATTKADAAGGGTLFSTALFASSKSLSNGETLDLTYTLNGSSS